MPNEQWELPEGWRWQEWANKARHTQEDDELGAHEEPLREMEPGWRATQALMQIESDSLLALMMRPSFRPVHDLDLVPVTPCTHCCDGGIRSVGSVRARHGRELVRACDTCGIILVGESVWPPVRR